jgi:hypothetical protein
MKREIKWVSWGWNSPYTQLPRQLVSCMQPRKQQYMKLCIKRGCFIIVSNVFRWFVTLGNRIHDISTETDLSSRCHRAWIPRSCNPRCTTPPSCSPPSSIPGPRICGHHPCPRKVIFFKNSLSCAKIKHTAKAHLCRAPALNARQTMCLCRASCEGARQRLTSVKRSDGLAVWMLENKDCRASLGKRMANICVCLASIVKHTTKKLETVR